MKNKKAFVDLYKEAKEKFNIKKAPNLILRHDKENAKKEIKSQMEDSIKNPEIT